ncbi:hypothetical protein D3C85_1350520 [compost metagenome]
MASAVGRLCSVRWTALSFFAGKPAPTGFASSANLRFYSDTVGAGLLAKAIFQTPKISELPHLRAQKKRPGIILQTLQVIPTLLHDQARQPEAALH